MTGYEPILHVILREKLLGIDGDLLEIGVLLGGGTRKLCAVAQRSPQKRVIAVDVFDPDFDHTRGMPGFEMAALYRDQMRWSRTGETDQRGLFDEVTRGCSNLVVVSGDSTTVDIPTERLCFAFIDGHHAPEYARKDFATCWSRLSPGGVVAMHDYGGDLPDLTAEVHSLIGKHGSEIGRTWVDGIIIFIQKIR